MSALPTQRPFCYAILTRFRTRMSQRNCHNQLFWSYMNLLSFAIFVEYLRNCFRQIESVKTAAKGSRNGESCMVSWPCHCFWKSLFKLTKVVWGHCIIILESCYTIATLDTDIVLPMDNYNYNTHNWSYIIFCLCNLSSFILRIFIAPFGSILKRANTPKICPFFLTSLFAFCHRC